MGVIPFKKEGDELVESVDLITVSWTNCDNNVKDSLKKGRMFL